MSTKKRDKRDTLDPIGSFGRSTLGENSHLHIPGQRVDLVVAGRIIVELKRVEDFAPIHQAQIISYLKATGLRLGLLLNFKTQLLKDGIKRVVR